ADGRENAKRPRGALTSSSKPTVARSTFELIPARVGAANSRCLAREPTSLRAAPRRARLGFADGARKPDRGDALALSKGTAVPRAPGGPPGRSRQGGSRRARSPGGARIRRLPSLCDPGDRLLPRDGRRSHLARRRDDDW